MATGFEWIFNCGVLNSIHISKLSMMDVRVYMFSKNKSLSLFFTSIFLIGCDTENTENSHTDLGADTLHEDPGPSTVDTENSGGLIDIFEGIQLPVSDYDSDGDGLSNDFEKQFGYLDENKKDTDGDGLDDKQEIIQGTWPFFPDTDFDDFPDKNETMFGTFSWVADSDGDGISDKNEYLNGTDGLDFSGFSFTVFRNTYYLDPLDVNILMDNVIYVDDSDISLEIEVTNNNSSFVSIERIVLIPLNGSISINSSLVSRSYDSYDYIITGDDIRSVFEGVESKLFDLSFLVNGKETGLNIRTLVSAFEVANHLTWRNWEIESGNSYYIVAAVYGRHYSSNNSLVLFGVSDPFLVDAR